MPDRRASVIEILHEVFLQVFDLDEIEISDSLSAHDLDEWDSLSHITLIVAVESRFGFRFKAAELEGLKNLGEMIDLIEQRAPDARLNA